MPKEVSKYPPGSYGAYLDQQAYLLQEKVRIIRICGNSSTTRAKPWCRSAWLRSG